MNRLRLSGIAVVLLIPIFLLGCDQETCNKVVFGGCALGCTPACGLLSLFYPFSMCMLVCGSYCFVLAESCYSLNCTGDPDECAATFEQLQLEAIQFCEAYPEECQQVFDSWVESFGTDAEE